MEPTQKINLMVDEFLRFYTIALKNMTMYSLGHSLVQQSMDRAHKMLQAVFEQKNNFTISIAENRLLRDDLPLEIRSPAVVKLIEMLQDHAVDSISFTKGISAEGLARLAQSLIQKPEELKAQGGIGALLEKESIPYIRVNEVKYGKISRSAEQVEDLVITNFLLGQVENLGSDQALLVEELKKNPEKFAQLMSAALGPEEAEPAGGSGAGPGPGAGSGLGGGPGAGPGGGRGRDKGQHARAFFEQATSRLAGLMVGKEADWRVLKKKLAQALIASRPDLKEALSQTVSEESTPEAEFMEKISGELSTDSIIAAVAGQYARGRKEADELADLLAQYIPDVEERKRLLPLLKQKLTSKGIDEDTFQKIAQDQLWEGMPPCQRAQYLLNQVENWNDRNLRKAKKTLEDLLPVEAYEEVRGLYQSIFEGLLSPQADVRKAVTSSAFDLLNLVEGNPKLVDIHNSIPDLLIKRLKDEENLTVLIALVDSLEKVTRRLMAGGQFSIANNLLEGLQLKMKAIRTPMAVSQRIDLALRSIADGKLMDTLINMLTHDDMLQRKEAARALIVFRNLAVDPLVERLAVEQSMSGRARIVQMITSLGQEAIEALKGRLADERWYVVRNAVSILGHIEAKDVVDFMQAPLHHPDERVRKETIRSLVKIGSEKAAILLGKALHDESEEVVELALDALVALGSRPSLSMILEIARGRSHFGTEAINLRKKAIIALGKMAHEPALPTLIEFIEKKGFLGMAYDEELREAAALALGLMGKFEAIESLKKAAKNDPTSSVREVAKRSLFNLERLSFKGEE